MTKENDKKSSSNEKILEEDLYLINLMKLKEANLQTQLELAQAKLEAASSNRKLNIFKIYIKYGLTDDDFINNDGSITRKVNKDAK